MAQVDGTGFCRKTGQQGPAIVPRHRGIVGTDKVSSQPDDLKTERLSQLRLCDNLISRVNLRQRQAKTNDDLLGDILLFFLQPALLQSKLHQFDAALQPQLLRRPRAVSFHTGDSQMQLLGHLLAGVPL